MTLADYVAKVKALEGGTPLHVVTVAESSAQLEGLLLSEDWHTAEEREVAQQLVIRLARLRRSAQSQPSGEDEP